MCIVILCLFASGYAEPSTGDGHVWVAGNLSIPFPSNAVHAGWIQGGTQIYVGRITHTIHGTLTAQVVAEKGTAFAAYYLSNNTWACGHHLTYEILVDEGDFEYAWIRSYDGFYEKGSVSVGTLNHKDQVFICRAYLNGELLLGNKYGYDEFCYVFSLAGIERDARFYKYEILMARPKCHG
ncbi:uncharacterized protein Dwil_GK16755 [Drosophila willistoni]|uniref:Uncharacterized protein n=2 Tax=Drosophila willistoni TaxID=7260 RepID=B4MMB4_DROWI|nr:uncharacterized protein Dwil_GK16755 [Drosophila willistoni]